MLSRRIQPKKQFNLERKDIKKHYLHVFLSSNGYVSNHVTVLTIQIIA
jgi:hypothetical protein